MKVGIITCMTCMFAVALTMGGPISSQASQSEKTFPIGGNVTLVCPFATDVTWQWVYWKKNDQTIYSLEVRSNTPWTTDTRYEGSNHATRLTIKDLQMTDSGIYHCKVATIATTDIIKEGGQVMLTVTDQEVGLPITSPGVPFRPSTTIPPQPAEDKTIFLIVFLIVIPSIIIINITVCLIFKYRERIKNSRARFMNADRRPALRSTSTPSAPGSSNRDSRDETSETGEKQLPLVGPVLIEDLYSASLSNRKSFVKRMRQVIHSLVEKYKDKGVPPIHGEYSASLRKYVRNEDRYVPTGVLEDVEYFLNELNHIPVGRKRDVCEILLVMPENQEMDTSMAYLNKDIFLEYDQDDQVSAVKREHTSRTTILARQMKSILRQSKMKDAARNYISLIILDAPVEKSGFASFSQQAASRYNQPASETEQETSFLLQRDEDSKREEDNLIEFWLSKITKLGPAVQRRISDRFDEYDQDADSSTKDKAMGRPDMQNADAKGLKKNILNESTDREKAMGRPDMLNADAKKLETINMKTHTDSVQQPLESFCCVKTSLNLLSRKQLISIIEESCAPPCNNQYATYLTDMIERMARFREENHDKDEEKEMDRPDMQNDDARELKITNFNESTDRDK